jgi:NAD-dependent deacetylase
MPRVFSQELLERLRSAKHVAILTGAGISAESGVPTFQGGFWGKYSPEELATVEGYIKDPKLVWDWYAERRRELRQIKPNAGHLALARLEQRGLRCTVITQNIDGLHQLAGSARVIELHGSLHRVKCFSENTLASGWENAAESPPRCPDCGAWLRPDVVWYGETLPPLALAEAMAASRACDLFFSIGTATQVYPAASLPQTALAAGVPVAEVNPDYTPFTAYATYVLRGPAGQVLPRLLAATWPA